MQLNIKQAAEYIWEIERLYNVMTNDANSITLYETWEQTGIKEQDGCIEKVTQLVRAGPDRIQEMINDMKEKKSDYSERVYTHSMIYLKVVKQLLETTIFMDAENKEVSVNYLH